MTAAYIPDDSERAQVKALLSLAAEGLAADVLEGTEHQKAAVQLGRALGRGAAHVVLSSGTGHAEYSWPQDWERAVRDYAQATAFGEAVTIRHHPQQATA